MRWPALLLVLAWLCAALALASAGPAPAAGSSLANVAATRGVSPKKYIRTTTYQWLQMAVSIRGKTCGELPGMDAKFRTAFTEDVTTIIQSTIGPLFSLPQKDVAAVVRTIGDAGHTKPCEDTAYKNVNYAGLTAVTRFRFTNATTIRDLLYGSAREGLCRGQFRRDVYKSVARLMVDNNLMVAFNNASRANPASKSGQEWVALVQPQRCDRSGAPVIESPGPVGQSPSPAPEVLPSPSPTPATADNESNARRKSTGQVG